MFRRDAEKLNNQNNKCNNEMFGKEEKRYHGPKKQCFNPFSSAESRKYDDSSFTIVKYQLILFVTSVKGKYCIQSKSDFAYG